MATAQEEPASIPSPELRQDVMTGEWVIMAPQRAQRPHQYQHMTESAPPDQAVDPCAFCPGQEHQTPAPLLVVPHPETPQQWVLRVLPNKYPALLASATSPSATSSALFPVRVGTGYHEVVVDIAPHDGRLEALPAALMTLVVRTWRDRFRALAAMTRVRHIAIFKNQGQRAGASLAHPHTQILATPVVSSIVQRRYDRARHYAAEQRRCLLCTMLEAERRARTRLLCEVNDYLILQPYAACFPYETWIVPRGHQASFGSLTETSLAALGQALQIALRCVQQALDNPAYNLFVHSAINEADEPAYHWYLQLIPRLAALAGFELGTGMAINPVLPEVAAARLRQGREKMRQEGSRDPTSP